VTLWREDFHDVVVRVVEVHRSTAAPGVDLAVPVRLMGFGVVVESGGHDALEDPVELGAVGYVWELETLSVTNDDRDMERITSGLGGLGYRLALVARHARLGFERRLTDAGASFASWTVLETLVVQGTMIQRDLADSLEVSGQTMTRHIDRMVAAGWLRRRDVEGDGRAVLVEVTKAGRALHRRLAEAARQANAALAEGLSARDLSTLDRLLDRLALNATQDR
jgi:MarR family transcriptional regulator for hemolysin